MTNEKNRDLILALSLAIEALKKQLPKKPLKQRYVNEELIGVCSSCKLQWDVAFYQRYCSNCGQKLDWSSQRKGVNEIR